MGSPPTKPIVLKDGWYIEVRNKGSRSGVKLRRDNEEEMNQAIKDFQRSKDVIVLGETKNGKWMNDKK